MIEVKGNLFNYVCDAICIPTNGYVNPTGQNVMGRGAAGEAKKRWPGIEREAGFSIACFGNFPCLLTQKVGGQIRLAAERFGDNVKVPLPVPADAPVVPYHILTFPTKPGLVKEDELMDYYRNAENKRPLKSGMFPGWMAPSSLALISLSAEILVDWVNERGWAKVALPRVGCGAGGLQWAEVKDVLENVFDDRFVIVNY